MDSEQQFARLARRAYVSYHADGLLDLLLAGVVFALGLGVARSWMGSRWSDLLAIGGFFIFAVGYATFKERVTIPRLGYAELRPDRRQEALVKILYPVVVCTFMILVLLVGDLPPGEVPVAPVWLPSRQWPALKLWMAGKGLLLFGAAALVVLGLIGLGTGLRRMYAYALIGAAVAAAGHLLGAPAYVAMWTIASVVAASGIVVFARFVRTHPVLAADETGEPQQGCDEGG